MTCTYRRRQVKDRKEGKGIPPMPVRDMEGSFRIRAT